MLDMNLGMIMKTFTTLLMAALLATAAHAEPLRYFGQTEQSYQSSTDYGNNTASGRYAVSDGSKIYYEVYGQGKPVVVLHGGMVGSTAEMGEFIDRLRPQRQVIAISTRGHGKSESNKVLPTYAQKAKDTATVLRQLGISQADFLGFSDGAYTALQFAADYPTQSGKIIAIGAGEWKRGFIQGGTKERAPFAVLQKLDPAYWAQQQTIRPNPQRTAQWVAQQNAAYNQTEFGAETFSRVQSPVLLVVGEDDQNAPLDTVIAAYKMLPNADLAVILNTPHPTFAVNFPAVWASVEPFLNR